jgi:uroporphyrinogen decarboxylase
MSPLATRESAFVRACWAEPVEFTPVWFMRQAGRSLPEYRKLRAGIPLLAACQRPDLVAEFTVQPVRRHHVDAAILFSDIVMPLAAAGIEVDVVPEVGPVVAKPIRDAAAVAGLPDLHPDQLQPVAQAVRLVCALLGPVPLIGFAGAPFTLASYLIEGGPSTHHQRTKALMYGAPEVWHALCAALATMTLTFLQVQTQAGVSAVQLFDSWAGTLSEADYRQFVLPHSQTVFAGLAQTGIPRIHFSVGASHLLPALADAGADVVGVDWRIPLTEAASRLPAGVAVQGNLDPSLLFAPWPVIDAHTRRIVAQGQAVSGHIFNLGHGVLPETDPDVLTRLVALVHQHSAR